YCLLLILSLLFFFLQLRRPPRSPLFPTRRSSDLGRYHASNARTRRSSGKRYIHTSATVIVPMPPRRTAGTVPSSAALSPARNSRSEEHTSELQSRGHLVCRLLLEKKKKHERPADR